MVSQKIDLATPLSNANSSIVSITYNIGQPVIGKSSNGMIKKGFLYLVRSSTPTVTLTDTDNNNIVTGSNVVTITAAFNESMIATPTINITGEVTNVAMTASSTASVWIYPWTVSTTTSGIVSATVAGIDVYGKVYAGTTSITFTISQTIYFENNTCKCPNATVGDSTTISGTTYIAVNNSTIAGQIAAGNYNLCTTLVTHMSSLFAGNSSFNSNIGFWDTSNVTTMGDLFQSADNFNQDISGWDVSNVTNMNNMFKYARSFNQNIGSWDVSSVTTMSVMFTEADDFNQDISGWNVTNVDNMFSMFNSADDFNQDLTGWCVSSITSEPGSFATSSALTVDNKPIWGEEFTVALTTGSNSQTVTGTTAITDIKYTVTPICAGSISASVSGLPSGVTLAFGNNVATISGTSGATGTFNYTVTFSGASTSEAVTGTITVNAAANTYSISVTASSNSDYTLSGTDANGSVSGDDASITINAGDTLNFTVDAASHPFYIKTAQGTGTDNQVSNVTNNGATNGTVNWTPTAAGTYYYQCSVHDGMYGTITVQ